MNKNIDICLINELLKISKTTQTQHCNGLSSSSNETRIQNIKHLAKIFQALKSNNPLTQFFVFYNLCQLKF